VKGEEKKKRDPTERKRRGKGRIFLIQTTHVKKGKNRKKKKGRGKTEKKRLLQVPLKEMKEKGPWPLAPSLKRKKKQELLGKREVSFSTTEGKGGITSF